MTTVIFIIKNQRTNEFRIRRGCCFVSIRATEALPPNRRHSDEVEHMWTCALCIFNASMMGVLKARFQTTNRPKSDDNLVETSK